MKKLCSTIVVLCCVAYAFSQNTNNWTTANANDIKGSLVEKAHSPTLFYLFQLDLDKMQSALDNCRQRGDLKKTQDVILEFPNAKGEIERYSVIEASTLHPDLSTRYGGIKSYAGQGIDDPTAKIRFSVSQLGFHGMIRSAGQSTVFIDPYTLDKKTYIVYAREDIAGITNPFNCYTDEPRKSNNNTAGLEKSTDDKRLRKYRLAMSCTAEYGNIFAGSGTDAQKKANILAQMNITMTRVNGVYEDDLAITMEIVANNDAIIYYGSTSSDPWSNEWNSTTQTVIDNAIGNANYDIGHNFNTTGGGNAGCIGCVCQTGNKGSGYTGRSNPTGDPFDIDYVAHEVGHQFGGYHTQSNSSCRSGDGTTEVEPGSGSTIMGYAGICSANVQNNSDDYFNYVNIRDISDNVQNGISSGCPEIINLGNNAPSANAGSNYTIPKSTAFVLRGQGSDPDGNGSLTYCWEQNDPESPGSNSAPTSTRTQGPMFRSIKGTSSPDRYMPQISDVVAGNLTPTWEVVPSVARNMEFALTVRDNTAGGGQTADDLMSVTVNGSAGPFVVSAPNTNVTWNVGSTETVTWSVAGTNSSPVNCANVNILLSTDGGFTYPVTIMANTPNDGSQVITVPGNLSSNCRVKVEAADNIFYDISNTNFTIEGAVTCNATVPSSLSALNVGSNSATLSWDAVPGATYDIRYRQTGTSTWTNVNGVAGTSTVINGLNTETSYEAQIRSVCSGGATSSYSSSTNFTTTAVQLNYCTSQGNNVSDEYIGRVQLGSINNTSGAAGYSDHTNISTDLTSETTNTITVTPVWTGTVYNEAYSVWIDYNQDGDFDDSGEQVWTQGNTQATSVSGNFTVPASAALGSTRMRVSMKYNGIPTACETFSYGEVEDYTVNIVSASCPVAGTACDDGDASTFNDVEDGNCGCAGTPCPTAGTSCDDGDASTFNDVEDGNCACAGTPCPTAGTSCDDGNPNTGNDVEDGNCNCAGVTCPVAGTSCDDGDASTFNDIEDGSCGCAGTPCPTIGTSCDDGDPSTFNDVEDGNCGCAGTPCPTAGTSCNDGDASTFNDVEDGNCGCAGTPCPTAGTSCDDGDASTFNDIEDGNCGCVGTPCPTAGTSCDDGNPNTENDVTDGTCGCAGTPINNCQDVTLTLNFDNYPEETSWSLIDANNTTVASGGTYPNQADGSTIVQVFCLGDGCYDFTINDAYGDGICCSYGNGSYSVTDASNNVLASGGSFTSSETTNFCIGSPPAPTCSDGIQNGQETGIDCGGPDCGSCVLNYCASQGNNVNDEYIGRVQLGSIDNTSGAAGYSDHTAISTNLTTGVSNTITVTPVWTGTVYNEAYSVWIDYNQDGDFDDSGEQVWTQGNTQATSVSGNFTVPGSALNGATRMRVSMKYNGIPTACETFNYGEVEDYTVIISGSSARPSQEGTATQSLQTSYDWKLYPNPVSKLIMLDIEAGNATIYRVLDLTGKVILTGNINDTTSKQLDVNQLQAGYYFLSVEFNDGNVVTKRFVKN